MRLIDANALEGKYRLMYDAESEIQVMAIVGATIDKQPTIDAVPKEKILLFLNIAKEELSKAHANKSVNGIMTWSASVTTLEGLLKEYDTADTDIVPVIRCRDCKYYPNGIRFCIDSYEHCSHMIDDGFCSWAERKPPQVNPEMVREMKERLEKYKND